MPLSDLLINSEDVEQVFDFDAYNMETLNTWDNDSKSVAGIRDGADDKTADMTRDPVHIARKKH